MKIKPVFHTILKLLLTLLQGVIGLFLLFMVYIAITDYSPDKETLLEIRTNHPKPANADSGFSFLIWNTGYAGLGAEMDFFYDGGKRVRPSKTEFQKYMNGILQFLDKNDTLDFILLQEVDRLAKRSYHHNQVAAIENRLDGFYSVFSKNYDVAFVPMPPTNPMGRVEAGMMTLSGMKPGTALRMALPQVYSWPMKYFMLDRAAVVTHYPIAKKKDLVVINIHNSAYVDDPVALEKEIAVIKDYATKQYQSGNYVVIGGDWNQNPPGFDTLQHSTLHPLNYQLGQNTFGKNWKWAWDQWQPTNRSLDKPLAEDVKKTIIDFYALSPNLHIEEIKALPMGFAFSDHEPVYLRVSVIPPQKNQK